MSIKRKKLRRQYKFGKGTFLVILFIMGCLGYALYRSVITDFMLKHGTVVYGKAVVEDSISGKTSHPVMQYRFIYQGNEYLGFASSQEGLRIGDTIKIVFLRSNPSMNRPSNEVYNQ